MSDHLTECIYEPEHWDVEQSILWGGKPCICDRLRACEQRIARLPHHEAIYADGFKAGVQAAREAVAGLEFFCTNPEQIVRPMAHAAIDALVKEDK